jgi:outer membrane protein assembly factor BamB
MYALTASTGKLLWQFKTDGDIKYGASFDSANELVTFGSFDKHIYVLSVQDGTLKHKFAAKGEIYATPQFFGRLIIVGSLDKYIYCFDLESGKTKWTVETKGRIFCSPYIDQKSGTVFVGSNDGILYEVECVSGKVVAKVQLSDRLVNRVQLSCKNNHKEIYVYSHKGDLFRLIGPK